MTKEIYGWVESDGNGGEYVIRVRIGADRMLLLGDRPERMENLRPFAEKVRRESGHAVFLVVFSRRLVRETLP